MAKHKLLVVDDELFVRELLDEYFSKLDFEVFVASSGPAALKLVAENKFKVALIDLKMNDMDGIEVLKRIRELDENLILILMTGYPTVESSIEAMRSGAYDYVIKPFRLNELKDIISRAVNEHQIRSEIIEIREKVENIERKLAELTGAGTSAGKAGKVKQSVSVKKSDGTYSKSGSGAKPDLDVERQLERWGVLLKEGLVSPQEFETNKKRILSVV